MLSLQLNIPLHEFFIGQAFGDASVPSHQPLMPHHRIDHLRSSSLPQMCRLHSYICGKLQSQSMEQFVL